MAITRTGLEENQVAIYFAAVVAGAIAAVAAPGAAWGAVPRSTVERDTS